MIPSWAMIAEDNNGKPRASGDDPAGVDKLLAPLL